MRSQLGSPGRAGLSRHVVRSARSTAARAANETGPHDSTDAPLLTVSSGGLQEGQLPRYPALEQDEQLQQQLSAQLDKLVAIGEDTETSCGCGKQPTASVPQQPDFNPLPVASTFVSVPLVTAKHALAEKRVEDKVEVSSRVTNTTEMEQALLSEGYVEVSVLADASDMPDNIEAGQAVKVMFSVNESGKLEPIESQEVVPAAEAEQPVQTQSTTATGTTAIPVPTTRPEPTMPSLAELDSKLQVTAPHLVSHAISASPQSSISMSQTLASHEHNLGALSVRSPSPPSPVMQVAHAGSGSPGASTAYPVSSGNDPLQTHASSRYPALSIDANSATQYSAPPSRPNFVPRPGSGRSPNCDAPPPPSFQDPSLLNSSAQLNVRSSPDYSGFNSAVEQSRSQSMQQGPSGGYISAVPRAGSLGKSGGTYQYIGPHSEMAQGNPQKPPSPGVPPSPPANPLPLAPPYPGGGHYGSWPPAQSADPWGLLERQGAYGSSQGLLHIDGGAYGGSYAPPPSYGGGYGAPPPPPSSYGPPSSQQYGGGGGGYGGNQSQQQYYSQPPVPPQQQNYSQRGGNNPGYSAAPPDAYYYQQAPAPQPPSRRQGPDQYMGPPNGNYYPASPAAGAMPPDPYTYGGSSYSGPGFGGGGTPEYGNQAYATPGNRGGNYGNYAPPPEPAQPTYPGIELLSPGYPEYEKHAKAGGQSKVKQSAQPPPEAYYPGIDSTFSAYGSRSAPANAPVPRSEYPGNQGYSQGGSQGGNGNYSSYSYYTAPSDYRGGKGTGGASGPPVEGGSGGAYAGGYPYPQGYGQGYQGYSGGQPGGYAGGAYAGGGQQAQQGYNSWPTAQIEESQMTALVMPIAAPSLQPGPVDRFRVGESVQAVQGLPPLARLEKAAQQQHIPVAALPAPTQMETLSNLADAPPSLDLGLLAAAFCCLMASKP